MRHLPDRRETGHERRGASARAKRRSSSAGSQRCSSVSTALRDAVDARARARSTARSATQRRSTGSTSCSGRRAIGLASWRVASEEINYRRFFDINDLAAIRMESPEVFEQSHALLFELLESGQVNALRLDHTDGLYDPLGYFEALQRRFRRGSHAAASRARTIWRARCRFWSRRSSSAASSCRRPGPSTARPATSSRAAAMGLLVDARAEKALTSLYESFTGEHTTFAEHVYRSKHHILRYSLASEVNMLGRALERIAERQPSLARLHARSA